MDCELSYSAQETVWHDFKNMHRLWKRNHRMCKLEWLRVSTVALFRIQLFCHVVCVIRLASCSNLSKDQATLTQQQSITTRRPEFSSTGFSFTGNVCPKCLKLFHMFMQNRKSHILSYETKHHSKNSALHKI